MKNFKQVKDILFKDINKLIYEIKRCKSKSMYNILVMELEKLYYICDILCISDYPNLESYSVKNYAIDDSEARKLNEYLNNNYEYYLEFSKNVNNIDTYYYDNGSLYVINDTYNIDKNINMLFEFLNEYNKDMYNLLKKIIDAGKLVVNRNSDIYKNISNIYKLSDNIEVQAFTIYTTKIDIPYICINDDFLITSSIFLAHELGHCYENMLTRFYSKKTNMKINHFNEVYSHYTEFIYMDFLIKNRICPKDVKNVKEGLNFELVCELMELNDYLSNFRTKDYFEVLSNLEYAFGITLAYHFYDQYLKDPEKADYNIKQFMQFNNYFDNLEVLEKLNLKDEIIDSKILKKYLKTI